MHRLEETDKWPPIVAQLESKAIRDLARQHGVSPGQISGAMRRTGLSRKPIRRQPRAQAAGRRGPPTLTLVKSGGTRSRGLNATVGSRELRKQRRNGSADAVAKLQELASAPVTARYAVTARSFVWSVHLGDDSKVLAHGTDLCAVGQVLTRLGISDVRHVERLGELLRG